MGKAAKYTEDSFRQDTSWVTWNVVRGNYRTGKAITPEGYVMVYVDEPAEQRAGGGSVMRFIYKGRMYHRRYDKVFTDRGLGIKAGQFAREITKKGR